MTIREYHDADLDGMIAIWNEVVEAGDAFPQEAPLTRETGAAFFASQTLDCLEQAKAHGFGILQFNAVVEGNVHARHLYERLGFTQLGTIPGGFRMKDGSFANICPYFRET